jgi:hypothetical protein
LFCRANAYKMPPVDTSTWLQSFVAAAGGQTLSVEEIETILALAGVAAHASERTAAPLTCWVAAATGLSPAAALEFAHSLAPNTDADSTPAT